MARTVLERARIAFGRRRYNDVINLLEPNLVQYRDSFQYYWLLALSCLHSSDIGGATSYLQRARQIRMREPDLLCAQAVLFLRRGDTNQAVEYYLEALEYAPRHPLAKKALELIRRKGDPEYFQDLSETGKIKRFYPRLRQPFPVKRVSAVGIALVLVFFAFRMLPDVSRSMQSSRADLSSLDLGPQERTRAVELGGSYRYILTEQEVLRTYERSRSLFQSWRDNAAQVEINRLLYSNASVAIKQKARLLMAYLATPGFDTIRDHYDFGQVSADLPLYQDVWVVWKGMATNIERTERSVRFELLVGYDTRNRLEGIVPVYFETVIPVDPERPLQVLGQVALEQDRLILRGGAVFQSQLPVQR